MPEKGTAYIQRLAPGASSWSGPTYLMDPAKYTYNVTRIQELNDGRLIATGNYWEVPAGTRDGRLPMDQMGWLLMVSSDQGRTWTWALKEGADRVPPNEWDVAEMPNGDLLAMMRTYDINNRANQYRRQAVLHKTAASMWTMETPRVTPFAHSGHPELLATREGAILNIATTGVHWTTDGGAHWTALPLTSGGYYPTAVQSADGTIHIFSHRGGDDDFGERDQAIVMDSFKLNAER